MKFSLILLHNIGIFENMWISSLLNDSLAQIPSGTDRCKTFIRTLNSSNECFCLIKDEKNCDWVSHKWVTSYLRYYHGKTYDIRKWKQSSQNDEIYNFEWIEWSILFSSFNPYEFNGNSNILRWIVRSFSCIETTGGFIDNSKNLEKWVTNFSANNWINIPRYIKQILIRLHFHRKV